MIRLLGPVAVDVPGGWHGGLTAQLRKVLAVLSVNRDAPLSAEQIVRRIWEGDPPDSAVQMIRNQITSVRRLFRPYTRDAVVRSSAGYRLTAVDLEVDAEQFRRLMQHGRREYAAGRPGEAVRAWNQALDLWHGPQALVDVRDVADLEVAAVGLEELRFQAEELLADGYLALGAAEQALPILRTLTLQHPSRELPWLRLMAAQTLIGRRIEASGETYRQAQHHLVEKTGLDAPLLAEVHRAVLRGTRGQDLISMIAHRKP
ncbi:MAG TPA: AfsR/SARP family transcriptional regulator [Actinoplanes sp.]|nr:AfsR/SARP family transcriptional regulator [Actinoplanes sp.]